MIGAVALMLTVSCTTLFRTVITVTEVRDAAMKELGKLSAAGFLTVEQDAKIQAADEAYLLAAHDAEVALVAYKNGGDRAAFVAALTTVKEVVGQMLAVLNQLNTDKTQALENKLALASTP